MSGKPGRSGRRPQKPWPSMVSVMPQRRPRAWAPSDEEWAGLQAPGKKFLEAMLEDSGEPVSTPQGILLLQAAHTLDALVHWRQEASSDLRKAKLVLAHTATFSNLLAAVRSW